jgi:hypothetical protein
MVRVSHRRVSTVFLAALLAVPVSGLAIIATAHPALALGQPDAPTAVVVTRGNGTGSVAFTPGSDNGNAISRFDASCISSNGGAPSTAFGFPGPVLVSALTNGSSYTCTVTATNVIGTSPVSAASNVFVPATSPSPPTAVVGSRGNTAASVAFTPGSNGGTAVTHFDVDCESSNGGASGFGTGATSPIIATALTNGSTYTCTVTATNAVGTSVPSGASTSFVPATVPSAPTIGTATDGDGTASVTLTPNGDGGDAVTLFTSTCTSSNGGALHANSNTTSPVVVTGLTNGRTYTCTATATNTVGTSLASAASNVFTHPGPPSPPTAVVATPGVGTASVAFTPGFDGNSPITGYTATCSPAFPGNPPVTGTDPTGPIVVTGLAGGVTYSCTVTATNALGTSAASAPSAGFAHPTLPQAPIGVVATPANAGASVAFVSGGDGGDPAHVSYLASCLSSDGGDALGLWSGSSSPIDVGGLTNGRTYTCTVRASNGFGLGPASTPSAAIVVSTIPGVPGPPTIGTAIAGDQSATVSFTAGNPGSAPIEDFTASCTSSDGGAPASGTDVITPIIVFGLTNGRTYTCAASERNSFGDSLLSSRTSPFLVGTIPSAPRSPSAIPGDGSATVHWTAPSLNGGAPVTGYVITPFLGPTAFTPRTINNPATTQVMSGLQNGKVYTFQIAAKNGVGVGPRSAATVGVLIGTPGPPRGVTAKPGEGQATVAWQVPLSASAGAITSYVITPYRNGIAGGQVAVKVSPRSRVFTGLSNGASYTFKVTAVNHYGRGAPSTGSPVITIGVPSVPTAVHLAQGPADSLQVTFVAPADNPVAISHFTATCVSSNGGVTQSKVSTLNSIKFSAPSRKRTYVCTVTATNSRGTSRPSAPSNAVTVA